MTHFIRICSRSLHFFSSLFLTFIAYVSPNLETKCYRDHTKDFLSSASFPFLIEQIKIEKRRDGFFSNGAEPTRRGGSIRKFLIDSLYTTYVYRVLLYGCVSFAWVLAPVVHSACIANFIDSRSRSGFSA